MCVQVVVEETSEPRISAILTATKFVSHSLGILLVYILGAVVQWNTASGVIAALPMLSIAAFVQLPESPVWLVKRNRIQEAEKALRWLRGGGVGLQVREREREAGCE
jgi:Sugar (and other) transporter.